MTSIVTKETLFRPSRSKAETKAETTNYTARAIIDAEAVQREAKTARLRQARLESEASKPAADVTVKTRRSKTSGVRRGKSSM